MNFANTEKKFPDLICLKQYKGKEAYKRLIENWTYTIQNAGGLNDEQIIHFLHLTNRSPLWYGS